MRTPVPWHNLLHRRTRSLVALSGVTFAVLLVFLQLGFLAASRRSAILVWDQLDGDLVLVSARYVFLRAPGAFPEARLAQARSVPGVAAAIPLRVDSAPWRNALTGNRYNVLLLGVDPAQPAFRLDRVNRALALLHPGDAVLVSEVAGDVVGPHGVGQAVELSHRTVRVAGTLPSGAGFIAPATVAAARPTFERLVGRTSGEIEVGLLRVEPGAPLEATRAALEGALPPDVLVLDRRGIERREQPFYMRDRPIGTMFLSGVLLGLCVCAVILHQVLATEIAQHVGELATLKAIGYGPGELRAIVVLQGLTFGALGYLPATGLAFALYAAARSLARLPVEMTAMRMAVVLALTLLTCAGASILAARRVASADPAELF